MKNNRKSIVLRVLVLCASTLFFSSCTRDNNSPDDLNSISLAEQIDVNRIFAHLESFQRIADDNSGHRCAGSSGHNASVGYIRDVLGGTNFILNEQQFGCRYFEEITVPVVEMTAPTPETYEWWDEFRTATFSGSGDVTAEIVFIDPVMPPGTENDTSTSGCETGDFTGVDLAGKIAVIQRGTCSHQVKAKNAEDNGAAAVLIFNEGTSGRTNVYSTRLTLGENVDIPVVIVSYEVGAELYNLVNSGQAVTVHVNVNARDEWTTTANMIAETPGGNANRIIVVGAHLDSVREGPGINDNGSGCATLLELARLMDEQGYDPVNKIVFAWWGAEEQGLLGSYFYINDLYENHPAQYQSVGMYLNLDMTASPNYIRGVCDSDGSDIPPDIGYIPPGASELEATIVNYFNSRSLPVSYISLTSASDQYCFAMYGVPSSFLYAGASGLKNQEQQDLFGGTVGQPYDSYYHTPLDNIANINTSIMQEMAQATAYVIQYYGDNRGSLFEGSRAAVRMSDMVPRVPLFVEKPDLKHKDRLFRVER